MKRNLYLYFACLIGLSAASPVRAQQAWFQLDTLTPVIRNAVPLQNPWAGGLNAGQFSTMDLNKDGVPDLVVFDRTTNRVSTFVGDAATKTYRHAPYFETLFPSMENWMLLVDFDADGQKELFTHTPQGIRVYKQTTTATNWTWKLHKPLLNSYGFSGPLNLLVVATDIPALIDVDDDGDMDIVTFEILGNFAEMHQNMSMERYGVPDSLEFVRNGLCWGNFVKEHCNDFSLGVDCGSLENLKDPLPNGRIMHAGNSILLQDLNGDGKKDMLMGHVTCDNVARLVNTGTNRVASFTSFDINFPAKDPINFTIFPAVYAEDVDFDGKKDLLAAPNVYTNEGNLMDFRASAWYYHNAGTENLPEYVLRQKDFLQDQMIDVGENAAPSFFDIDGDGDQDMLVGTGGVRGATGFRGSLLLFRNVGTAQEPRFEWVNDEYLDFSKSIQLTQVKPQWADFDGDGVADLGFAGISFQGLEYRYLPNRAPQGAAVRVTMSEAVVVRLPAGVQASDSPYFYDTDQDGDLDLIVGKAQGNIEYYLNTGTVRQPVFDLQTESLAQVRSNFAGRFVSISVADMDLDGRPDLLTADQTGMVRIFHSGAWGQWTRRDSLLVGFGTNTLAPKLGAYLHATTADYSGDGKPDVAVGTYGGGVRLLRNILPVSITSVEPSPAATLVVYPNPARNYVQIRSRQEAFLDIFTSDGRLMKENLQLKSTTELSLEVSKWTPGLYIFRARYPDRQESHKVMVE
ncbi:FG-GAP-like repeat-containing protein [Arundinibacter roseus]|uniref:T9SS type A sorting domain-containing protein n=1 Tax=Arundinibacter roseus TaxID=2070510 RepID=A0A4R4K0M8_9BACT|nr:FG-GAP-like repeat-containing protein [Arundinibacter roseus]TDB60032.1 T9SS type A sorting domain-containing protein [Arundinibacter roseus]